MSDKRVELTKELYAVLAASLKGLPSEKPVAIEANVFRALLRSIDPAKLPAAPKDDLPDTVDAPTA